MGDADRIVFPDEPLPSPSPRSEASTVASEQSNPSSNVTVYALVIVGVCVLLIVGVFILYKKHRNTRKKRQNPELEISLPTLGTQYELNSLISINTVGRKSSRQSEESNEDANMTEGSFEKSQDVFDGRVSKYIDASAIDMNKSEDDITDGANYSFQNILDVTTEKDLGSTKSFNLQPPHAFPESSTSRPMSMIETETPSRISIIGESRPISKIMEELSKSEKDTLELPNNPTVQVFPPSPSFKRRPRSENVENLPPPTLPAKKKLGSATSEIAMTSMTEMPTTPTSARSDSHLAFGPPIPPKHKPLLPPKQTINKSKDDVDKINKDIARKSSLIIRSNMANSKQKIEVPDSTDIDYDFPTRQQEDEDEEYDEPCPIMPSSNYHDDD